MRKSKKTIKQYYKCPYAGLFTDALTELTQRDLAPLLGVSQPTLCRFLNNIEISAELFRRIVMGIKIYHGLKNITFGGLKNGGQE